MAKKIVCLGACLGFFCLSIIGMAAEGDSFPPLKDGKLVPQNLEELWSGYDPRKEPLETEILKEWEDDGIVCRIVRYRIGVFKGQKAVMGAIYAFPKGGRKLPGLVQLHGGGAKRQPGGRYYQCQARLRLYLSQLGLQCSQ